MAVELEKPESIFLVAEEEGIPVGYLGLEGVLDEGYIANVAVHPGYRRRGIASILLEEMIRLGHEKEFSFLTLEVRPSNHPAIALYTHQGFKEEGRRKNFYSDPREDALIMTKRLKEMSL